MALNAITKATAEFISKSILDCSEKLRLIFHFKSNEQVYLLIFFIIITYLSFAGLNNNSFWSDEAETALIAKNFIKTGALTGWDGRNLYTFRQGTMLYPDYEVRIPPLQVIVTACSFKLFGASTWTGRLPFVVFGLLSLIFLYLILNETFGGLSYFRWYALILVACSYSFLFSIRQCRYYSLSLLFTLSCYYFYRKILKQPRPRYFLLCLTSLLLSFFSHFPICLAFLGALIPVHFIFHRTKFRKKEWFWSAGIAGTFCAVIAPYWLRYHITYRPDLPAESLGNHVIHFFYTIRELDFICYFPFIIAAVLVFFIVRYRKEGIIPSAIYEWIAIVGFMCLTSAFTTRQPIVWLGIEGGLIDVRYLFVFLPFCAACTAFAVWVTHRALGGIIASMIVILLLSSNLLSFNINKGGSLRWPLPGYLYEIHNRHSSPYDTTVSYLRSHALKNDIVYTVPDYNLNIFHFYLGDSLIMGSLLTRNSPLPVEKLRKADYPAYIDDYFPHWIVVFGMTPKSNEMLNFFARGPYAYTMVKNIAIYWGDMTRPELPWHSFVRVKVPENSSDGIFIFKRIEKLVAKPPDSVAAPETAASVPYNVSRK